MTPQLRGAATAAMLMALSSPAAAVVVVDSIPYLNTPEWTDIAFANTKMVSGNGATTFETTNGQGVWFGWGTSYGNQPAWSPGSPSVGNYFSLTASFSANAADWSAYFFDTAHTLSLSFNPTIGCTNGVSCYDLPVRRGVNLMFADAQNNVVDRFVELDTTKSNTYEFLLKGGQLSYRINGVTYSGAALASGLGSPLLVVGDGSASTPTGVGSMTITAALFDNAPAVSTLESIPAVPEPEQWAMLVLGFGLTGAVIRRRARSARLEATA